MRTAITAIATLALGLGALTACSTTDPAPTPTPTTVATMPTAPPKPSPTPTTQSPVPTTASATPTQTLDADQDSARAVVLKLFELQNQFAMDGTLKDYTPLTNITIGNAEQQVINAIVRTREMGAVQIGSSKIKVLSVGEAAVDETGTKTIPVNVCVDATAVDKVKIDTGESVLSPDRDPVNLFTLDVITQGNEWLVNDLAGTATKACP